MISRRRRKRGAVGFDGSRPTISNIVATQVSDTSITVTWTTNKPTSSNAVNYGTTMSYGSTQNTSTGNGVSSHSATITGLTAETGYNFRVRSTSGGETVSSNQTITLERGLWRGAGSPFSVSPFQKVSTATNRQGASAVVSSAAAPLDSNTMEISTFASSAEISNAGVDNDLWLRMGTFIFGFDGVIDASTAGAPGLIFVATYDFQVRNGANTLDPSGAFSASVFFPAIESGEIDIYARKATNLNQITFNSGSVGDVYEINHDYTLGIQRSLNGAYIDWDNSSPPTTIAFNEGTPEVVPNADGVDIAWGCNIPHNYHVTLGMAPGQNQYADDREYDVNDGFAPTYSGIGSEVDVYYTITVYGTGGTTTSSSGMVTTNQPALEIVSYNVIPGSDGVDVEVTTTDSVGWNGVITVQPDGGGPAIDSDTDTATGDFWTFSVSGSLTPETSYDLYIDVEDGQSTAGTDSEGPIDFDTTSV